MLVVNYRDAKLVVEKWKEKSCVVVHEKWCCYRRRLGNLGGDEMSRMNEGDDCAEHGGWPLTLEGGVGVGVVGTGGCRRDWHKQKGEG